MTSMHDDYIYTLMKGFRKTNPDTALDMTFDKCQKLHDAFYSAIIQCICVDKGSIVNILHKLAKGSNYNASKSVKEYYKCTNDAKIIKLDRYRGGV